MALVNCPECGKEISDSAKSCPHCGYPLSEDNTEKKASPLGASPVSVVAFVLSILALVSFFATGVIWGMAGFMTLSLIMGLIDNAFIKGNRIFTLLSLIINVLILILLFWIVIKMF